MSFTAPKCLRMSFRTFLIMLCGFYVLLIVLFHSGLDPNDPRSQRSSEVNAKKLPKKKPIKLSPEEIKAFRAREFGIFMNNSFMGNRNPNPFPELMKIKSNHVQESMDNKAEIAIQKPPPDKEILNKTGTKSTDGHPCFGDKIPESNTFVELGPRFYVYSVFWDNRVNDFDNSEGGVYLRIMSVISQQEARAKKPVYCLFKGDGVSRYPVLAKYYEMCENHARPYGGHILSCLVPNELYNGDKRTSLCSISLSHTANYDDNKAKSFAVINTEPVANRDKFTICTSPLYGDIKQNLLMEFMELSSILGASRVVFYDFAISADTKPILEYYQQIGKVTLVPWALPKVLDEHMWYHGQLVAVLDCLYRNMAKSEYVAINDIDEYIVPYNNNDWTAMINSIDNDQTCGYQFNSAFFDPRKSIHKANKLDLITVLNTQRSTTISRVRTKCLLKPRLVFEAGIHHISKPILATLQTVRMDLPTALLHHHRTCMANYGMSCNNFVDDPVVPMKYGPELVKRVNITTQQYRLYQKTLH